MMNRVKNKKISTIGKVLLKILTSKSETFIFFATLSFYFLLWFIDPGNKMIALAFIGLILLFYYKLKSLRISLLFAYIASSIVFTGKTYLIQLVPPGIFPKDIYPLGYVIFYVISPKHIVAALMFLFIVRDLVNLKLKYYKFKIVDLFLVLYVFWVIFSDTVASKTLEISLPFSLLSFEGLIIYFYMKFYFIKNKKFVSIFIWLFVSLVLIETFIAVSQLMASSPINKNIEAQVDIEYFGHAADELLFRFRPLGTFDHANTFGMWLSFVLSLIIAVFLKFPSRVFFASLLLGVISLVMSLSRSAWIGITASILSTLYILEKVKKIKINIPGIIARNILGVAIISISVFMFFIIPRLEKSLYSFGEGGGTLRLLQLEDSVRLIFKNPLFGVGSAMSVQAGVTLDPTGVFGIVPLAVHNWFILVAAEHGLPALIFFLVFVIISTKQAWVEILNAEMNSLDDYLNVGIIASILALFIVATFQPFIGENLIFLSLGLLSSKRKV